MSETKKERKKRLERQRKRARTRVQESGINETYLTNYTIDRMEEEGLIPTREQLKTAKEQSKKKKNKRGMRGFINKRTRGINNMIKDIGR